jgi:hypothetical protein
MAYRKQKPDVKEVQRQKGWIEANREILANLGLPPIVRLDFAHWSDFLENGCLDHHEDSTGFSVDQLTTAQVAGLRRFLESEYSTDYTPPLLRWLRNRSKDGIQK